MEIKKVAAVLVLGLTMVAPGLAYEVKDNPDRFPSIGVQISDGLQTGILKTAAPGTVGTNGRFINWKIDYRYPLNSYVTLNAEGEVTGINNNRDYTNGHRISAGMRVYLK